MDAQHLCHSLTSESPNRSPSGFDWPQSLSTDALALRALEYWPEGVLLVASPNLVVWSNRAAQRLLNFDDTASQPPVCVRVWLDQDQRRFEACFEAVQRFGGKSEASMLIRRQDGVPLVAHCWLLDDGMVAVALREVGKQRAQVLHLAAYFEWTEAEGHLAQGLLDNLTVHEFAAIQGVAVSTVRTHLIGLFKKTGTRRQAELIRLLLQLQ